MQDALEKLVRQQVALAAFGSYAFREPSVEKVLNEAARICAQSLGTPYCKVCRYRPELNDLIIVSGVGWQEGVIGVVVSAADDATPQARAFRTGQPVILRNVKSTDSLTLPTFYADHHITSTIDVCIHGASVDMLPWGVLEVDSSEDVVYDERDIAFLSSYANVLAESVSAADRTRSLHLVLEQMRALVDEKVILAQELQHRVRNNLQLINGMLVEQIRQTTDTKSKSGIHGIVRRVMSLSRVYDHLLGVGMCREVDFAEYVKLLCTSLPDLQRHDQKIDLKWKVVPMLLDLDTVTALGLALVEVVSNSYEHAFPDKGGTIKVILYIDGEEAILHIKDDGIGFVIEECQPNKRHGVGLVARLMQQAKGTAVCVPVPDGTLWELRFPCLAKLVA